MSAYGRTSVNAFANRHYGHSSMEQQTTIPPERIAAAIHVLRGQRVMLDEDLAALYGVPTKRLNEQVRRNIERFPADFMFILTAAERSNLRSQFATSSSEWGGRRTPPAVFTEHGAVMLASVLKTRIAVEASIQVVRAFVHLRGLIATNAQLARRLDALELKYDSRFKIVFEAIRALMTPAESSRGRIGFSSDDPGERE